MSDMLLHIYDATDLSIAATAAARRNLNGELVWPIPIHAQHGAMYELRDALDELRNDGKEFRRALFETHGSSGVIRFGAAKITLISVTSCLAMR